MRAFLVAIAIFGLSFSASVHAAGGKKFHRALILAGGGLNLPLHLGFLDGVSAAGKVPDVIVGSSGGSIVAALANAIPDSGARYDFLRSKEFYGLLKNLELNDITLVDFFREVGVLRSAGAYNLSKSAKYRVLARNLFNFSVLHVDGEFDRLPQFQTAFSSQGIRVVVIGARMEFTPDELGHYLPRDRKLFTETYFTDPDTATALRGAKSFTGVNFPSSAMAADAEVADNIPLNQAVRASIAEPLLTTPAMINGRYYYGGGADLNPLFAAQQLADEIYARVPTEFEKISAAPAVEASFGFDPNEVADLVAKDPMEHWIDVPEGRYPSLSPDAKLNLSGAVENFNPARLVKVVSLIPDTYEGYLKVFDAQYLAGYQGAWKAASAAPADVSNPTQLR